MNWFLGQVWLYKFLHQMHQVLFNHLQHDHTIAKQPDIWESLHLYNFKWRTCISLIPRPEANLVYTYPGWPGYEANYVYTYHWYVYIQVTWAALQGRSQTMPYVYLFRASNIHAWQSESNENGSIRIVWLTGKVLVAARIDGGRSGEGLRCRGKGEGEGER